MTLDAEALWNFVCDSMSGADSENELQFDIKDLYEIVEPAKKMERLLKELQAGGYIGKYSCNEDFSEIRVERKKETDFDSGSNEGDSESQRENRNENVEGLYHITKEFLEELQEPDYLAESKIMYYRMSGNMKDILSVAGKGMTLPYEELLDIVIRGMNQFIYFEEGGRIQARAFFITGNGGVGKTTLLATAALKTACETKQEVYIMQIKSEQSVSDAEKIISIMKGNKAKVLFIDNPYDNKDVSRYLIEHVRSNRNIKLVFSERANRLEQLFKNPDLGFISNIAGAVVIVNQGRKSYSGRDMEELKFVRRPNTKKFILSKSWKKQVVAKMISYILPESLKIDDERLQRILETANYAASPCEILLQVCLQYNQEIEDLAEKDRTIEVKIPFQFDWDEWKRLFSSEKAPALPSKELSLGNIFPFIAALGLYKIQVTTRFIANLIQVNEVELGQFLNEKLSGVEPVRYDGEQISLKHDIIADLYFQAHKKEKPPQYYLMEAIKYLDEFMIIKYERYVLSTKIIRGKREVPHNSINTIALLKSFEQYESYIQCLINHNRFYSYEYAKIFSAVQEKGMTEDEFQGEWNLMLNKVPEEDKHRLSLWTSCFTVCMEMNYFPPDRFFTMIEQMNYRVVTRYMSNFESFVQTGGYNSVLYRRIARKVFQSIMDNNKGDIPSVLALVKILMEQSAVLDAENVLKEMLEADIENKFKVCVEYASICRERYIKLDKRIKKIERWKKRSAPASSINKIKDRNQTQSTEEVIISERTETVQADESGKPKKEPLWKQRNYYYDSSEKYYRMAVDIAPEKDKAQPLCALADFLLQTSGIQSVQNKKRKRIQEAEKCLLKALEIGTNNCSAYNILAMIYGREQKWNPLYNQVKADEYFEKAVKDCPKDMLVTRYVPWGNLNYNVGKLESAREKYEKALQYKPNEIRAVKAIKLIDEEQYKLDALLLEEPVHVKTFRQLYYYVPGNKGRKNSSENEGKKSSAYKRINSKIFKNDSAQRDILRLVYKTCRSDEITPAILKKCKNAMQNLSVIGKVEGAANEEIGFLYLRIAQYMQMCCIQHNERPYLSLNQEQTFAHIMLRHFKKMTSE